MQPISRHRTDGRGAADPDDERLVAACRAARSDPCRAVLEGLHALKHALRFDAAIERAVTADRTAALRLAGQLAPDLVGRLEALLEEIPAGLFGRLTPTPPATGVVAIARRPRSDLAALLGHPAGAPLVLLENPGDLGNIGAVVRVAAAAGAAGVLATGRHDPWHPAALRGSAGLHFALPVARIEALPSSPRPLVALHPEGEPLDGSALPEAAVLAFGTERDGLSPRLLARACRRIAIPMTRGVSSLNLATAVAVTLYAWRLAPSPRCGPTPLSAPARTG
jgi:tRNA G18 (ribose-2'-O)-methylase SpoU